MRPLRGLFLPPSCHPQVARCRETALRAAPPAPRRPGVIHNATPPGSMSTTVATPTVLCGRFDFSLFVPTVIMMHGICHRYRWHMPRTSLTYATNIADICHRKSSAFLFTLLFCLQKSPPTYVYSVTLSSQIPARLCPLLLCRQRYSVSLKR